MAEPAAASTSKPKSKSKHTKKEPSCTVEVLQDIITAPSGGKLLQPSNEMDQVYPNLYIGNESCARNLDKLKLLGFTHIVNTAKGPKDKWHVNTSAVHYKSINVQFLGIDVTDMVQFRICNHFNKTSEFIDKALINEGRVLVHCREGRSRSATIVVAFLMQKRHLTVQESTYLVRQAREICPNDGFMQQLCNLNDKLICQKHFDDKHELL